LFFGCCVAKVLWNCLAECLDLNGDWSYEFVASLWIANKKHLLTNAVLAAALWCLWNLRNKICFQGGVWTGLKELVLWIAKTLRRWKPMFSGVLEEKLEQVFQLMEMKVSQPPRISWHQSSSPTLGSQLSDLGSSDVILLNSDLSLAEPIMSEPIK
jgi:hypothetical protein